MEKIICKELGCKVLGMAYKVHNILGPGLLESAYEDACFVELVNSGLQFERQKVYALHYKGEGISGYIADLVVENTVLLELKSVSAFIPLWKPSLLITCNFPNAKSALSSISMAQGWSGKGSPIIGSDPFLNFSPGTMSASQNYIFMIYDSLMNTDY